MKNILLIILAIFFQSTFAFCQSNQKDFPDLHGSYLGQNPPGMIPEIFAPGIISTRYSERIAAFTPNGKELYYVMGGPPHSVILCTKEENGIWTIPEVVPFSGRNSAEFNISPDGNKIVYIPKPFDPSGHIWMVKRDKETWGEPQALPPFINGYPSLAENDNLYFNAENKNNGSWDVYVSIFENGEYLQPLNLGNNVNDNELHEADPFIAPDESYIIFSRIDPEGFGGADLFICYCDKKGNWTKSINMGKNINTSSDEYCPTVSPDGKFLFFLSYRKTYKNFSENPISLKEKLKIINSPGNGNGDIYWVDAQIIEYLKPKDIK